MKLPPRHCQLLGDLHDWLADEPKAYALVDRIEVALKEDDIPERPRRQYELIIHAASDQPLAGGTLMDHLEQWFEAGGLDVQMHTSFAYPTSTLHIDVKIDPDAATGEAYRVEGLAWEQVMIADRDG